MTLLVARRVLSGQVLRACAMLTSASRVYAYSQPLPCPECETVAPGYNASPRRWRHLNTMQWKTFVECAVPRVNCPEHGVHQIRMPWAEDLSRFTAMFEAFTIDVLESVRSKVQAIKLTGLSWDQVDRVMAQAVKRGLNRREFEVIRFHIVRELTRAVDLVRRAEHRELTPEGHDEVLKKSKYVWLKNPANWTDSQRASLESLKHDALKVGRAWSIKEAFQDFWSYRYAGCARKFFDCWYFWATHSRLAPTIAAARTLKRHLQGLLAYFRHRITNASAEGLNSKIQSLKANARGFRNFGNYRVAILFHCGALCLYPHGTR